MTEEEDECPYRPKLAPRDRPACTVDAVGTPGTSPRNDLNEPESIVYTVIEQLADTLDEDPMAMRPMLGDVIDPEILVRLQHTGDGSVQTFTFRYRDHVVITTNHGAVSVRRPPSERSS